MFTLNEALDAIKNKPEFKVINKKDYTVIDYQITMKDTFVGNTDRETKILTNLRGTAFNTESGEIVSLPFHKFHNLGEKPGYMMDDLDISNIESVMLKLDGSMIRTIRTSTNERGWVFGTRAGETDVSEFAENWYRSLDEDTKNKYRSVIEYCICLNLTPIFEFTSRKNKVVVDYPTDSLTLLAIRSNVHGGYMSHYFLTTFSVDVVETYDEFNPDNVRTWTEAEGIVVSFYNGFRVKIKADLYVKMHRAKDMLRHEKDVVKMILEGTLDDIMPLVEGSLKQDLLDYNDSVLIAFEEVENNLKLAFDCNMIVSEVNNITDRKLFAQLAKQTPNYTPFLFSMLDGKGSRFKEHLISQCASGPKLAEILMKYNLPRWSNDNEQL